MCVFLLEYGRVLAASCVWRDTDEDQRCLDDAGQARQRVGGTPSLATLADEMGTNDTTR